MFKKIIFSFTLLALCLVFACKNEPKATTTAESASPTAVLATPSVDSAALQVTADSLAVIEKAAADAASAKVAADAQTKSNKGTKTVVVPPAKGNTKTPVKPVTPAKTSKTTIEIKPEPKFDDKNVVKRPGRDDVLTISEIAPAYPGGVKEMMKFLQKNIKYPVEAKEKGIKGTVYVKFVVEKDGKVDDVLVKKGVNALLDKEAVRVVTSMPKWTPGKQNGTLVAVRYTLPVKFDLVN